MTSLTIDLDDRLIDALRETAARRQTTVERIVKEWAEELANVGHREQARAKLEDLVSQSSARMGPDFVWSREATYADRMFPRHERPDLRSDGKDG